jgi:DNA-binding transcriptional MerR regulator
VTAVHYFTTEVIHLTGLTFRQIDYWCRVGIIVPKVEADGSGTKREFSIEQVRAIALCRRLADLGMRAPGLTEVYADACDWHEQFWAGIALVSATGMMTPLDAATDFDEACYVVNLDLIVADLRERIERAPSVGPGIRASDEETRPDGSETR